MDYLRTDARGVAVERIAVPAGVDLADILHPDLAEACHPQGEAQVGDIWDADAKTWAAPPPPPAPPLPDISRAQAKIQLHRAELLTKVEDAVKAAGGEVAIWYAEATVWQRANPYIAQLGAGLGLSGPEIDALFVRAAQIQA